MSTNIYKGEGGSKSPKSCLHRKWMTTMNIFNHANVISFTLKTEELRATVLLLTTGSASKQLLIITSIYAKNGLESYCFNMKSQK